MNRRGVTILELMIALFISAIIVAGVYRVFLTQQRSYAVQDDVVDMQQSVRVAVSVMMRELRMAGFGNIGAALPVTINGTTYANIVNPNVPSAGALTILAALGGAATLTGINGQQITVNGTAPFDTGDKSYISIAGSEAYHITSINVGAKTLTLDRAVVTSFDTNGSTPVYVIRAITYILPTGTTVLRRNGNLGGGNVSLAEDIEGVDFQYFDGNGNVTANPANIRTIRVVVTARTKSVDPQLKVGDGYRRRQVASNILLRNMGL